MTLKIYLAGPEVFLRDARQVLDAKAAMTRAHGFTPLCPGDLEIPPSDTRRGMGQAISAIDEHMMNMADAIIANLTPFRGLAADTGTAFELGYMCAQGKRVYAYTNVADDHHQRLLAYYEDNVLEGEDGRKRGPDGLSLENFDMADNLMLQGGIERRGGAVIVHRAAPDRLYSDLTAFEACLKAMSGA